MNLTQAQVDKISKADDLHVAPYYEDGVTTGTLTWIWSVVVQGDLFVRAWNGSNSRWFDSAKKNKSGIITIGHQKFIVDFEEVPVSGNEVLQKNIDEAYRLKYKGSPYLVPMVSDGPKEATMKIIIKEGAEG